MRKKIYPILLFVILLALSKDSVHANDIAIDVTRLYSYSPSFSSTISALEDEGYTVEVWEGGEVTADRLAGFCTLIIVSPQAAYTNNEVTAILDFVSSGHGLLFLGEYGKTWYDLSGGAYPDAANPIIGPLGVSINNDLLYDPTDCYQTKTSWPEIHTFPVAHPVTDGMGIFMPAATATLEVDSPATIIATGDDDTYAVDPPGLDPTGDSPPVVTGIGGSYEPVMAVSTYGMGRAVVAGDHNWITDAYSTYYDNIELLVNVVKWLCPAIVQVTIDIKPGSCPNPLNVNSKGVLPVAILGTEDFDVYDVSWAMLEDIPPIKIDYYDATTPIGDDAEECECNEAGPDGYMDLVLYFDTQEIVGALGLVEDGDVQELNLMGEDVAGIPIGGSDCIRIIKKGKD